MFFLILGIGKLPMSLGFNAKQIAQINRQHELDEVSKITANKVKRQEQQIIGAVKTATVRSSQQKGKKETRQRSKTSSQPKKSPAAPAESQEPKVAWGPYVPESGTAPSAQEVTTMVQDVNIKQVKALEKKLQDAEKNLQDQHREAKLRITALTKKLAQAQTVNARLTASANENNESLQTKIAALETTKKSIAAELNHATLVVEQTGALLVTAQEKQGKAVRLAEKAGNAARVAEEAKNAALEQQERGETGAAEFVRVAGVAVLEAQEAARVAGNKSEAAAVAAETAVTAEKKAVEAKEVLDKEAAENAETIKDLREKIKVFATKMLQRSFKYNKQKKLMEGSLREVGERIKGLEKDLEKVREELVFAREINRKLSDGMSKHLKNLSRSTAIFEVALKDENITYEAAVKQVDDAKVSFGKVWSIYKRIHQPNYVRRTVTAFGKSLRKTRKDLTKQRKKRKDLTKQRKKGKK